MHRRAVPCRLPFPGPLAAVLILGGMVPASAAAQTTLSGRVVFEGNDEPAHNAEVVLLGTDHVVHTDEEGRFEFTVAKPQAASIRLLAQSVRECHARLDRHVRILARALSSPPTIRTGGQTSPVSLSGRT